MKTKFILALLIGMMSLSSVHAQMSYVPVTAYRFSVGADLGMTTIYGDLPTRKFSPALRLAADHRLKEYITIGAEVQVGFLASGVKGAVPDGDKGFYSRAVSWGYYNNNLFQAVNLNAKVFVGQFNSENTEGLSYYINNIYVGAGVGVINNSMTEIVSVDPRSRQDIPTLGNSIGILVPLNLGINVPIPNSVFMGTINYQMNFSTSEGIDGYNFGITSVKDAYSFLSIGIRYNFGEVL